MPTGIAGLLGSVVQARLPTYHSSLDATKKIELLQPANVYHPVILRGAVLQFLSRSVRAQVLESR